jgi:hypothetical protein
MTCSVCAAPVLARGLCSMHYQRMRKHGDPHYVPVQARSEIDRFWHYVELSQGTDCWLWRGGLNGAGYGVFASGSRTDGSLRSVMAHRYAYELLVGPIPDGLYPDHLCRIPACVRPTHIELVTPQVNTLRGIGPSAVNARKTVCSNGHAFTPENTWHDPKRNTRHCRACARERSRRRRALARTGPEAA